MKTKTKKADTAPKPQPKPRHKSETSEVDHNKILGVIVNMHRGLLPDVAALSEDEKDALAKLLAEELERERIDHQTDPNAVRRVTMDRLGGN